MSAACPRCRLDAPLLFRVGDLNRRIGAEDFSYFRCPACAIVFLAPIPVDLGRYYESDYYDIPASLEALAACAEPERFKIEIVLRYVQRGSLLEIGPAWGNFAYLAKQVGFQVDAIEQDGECCRYLNTVVGVRALHASNVETALQHAGSYDVITLWHVFEHLPDPWEALRLMALKLNPGGILVIAAPNPDAFQFRVLGRYWTHIDAPRHLELIPMRALIEHGRNLGLKTVSATTTDQGSLGWNMFGWAVSLANFHTNQRLSQYLHLAGRVIGRLLRRFESREGKGSAYTIVLRKGENK